MTERSPWSTFERDSTTSTTRLVGLLAERGDLIREVIDFKRTQRMGVVDRGREDDMLVRIGALASQRGLDPRIARQVLRAVIDAFTLLEVEAARKRLTATARHLRLVSRRAAPSTSGGPIVEASGPK